MHANAEQGNKYSGCGWGWKRNRWTGEFGTRAYGAETSILRNLLDVTRFIYLNVSVSLPISIVRQTAMPGPSFANIKLRGRLVRLCRFGPLVVTLARSVRSLDEFAYAAAAADAQRLHRGMLHMICIYVHCSSVRYASYASKSYRYIWFLSTGTRSLAGLRRL